MNSITKEERKEIIKTLQSFGLNRSKNETKLKEVSFDRFEKVTSVVKEGYYLSKDSKHILIDYDKRSLIEKFGKNNTQKIQDYQVEFIKKISQELENKGFELYDLGYPSSYEISIIGKKNRFDKGGKVTWKKNIGEDGWSATMENQSAYDNEGGYISESGNWIIFRQGRWYVREDDGHNNFKRDGNWIVQGKNEYGLIEDIYGEFKTLKEAKDYVENWVNINPQDFKKGGKVTWRNKYNKKYGFDKDESHSLKDISKKSGVSMKGLQQIYNKGIGAYKTNPSSVRPNVTSKEQWAMGRVYSAVMGGKASKVDAKELKMSRGGKLRKPRNTSGIKFENGKYYNQYGQEYEIDWDVYDKIKDKVINPTFEALRIKKMDIGGKVEKIEEMKEIQTKGDMGDKVKFLKENPEIFMGKVFNKGGKSRTRQDVIDEINKLNEQNRSGKIPYAKYYRAYEKLRKEAEAIKRYNSFPQQMKRFGASVKKAYGRGSYYYIGKHIDAEINAEDTSMGERWEVTTIFDKKRFGSEPRLQNVIKAEFEDDYYPYETKKEATMMLYNIDSGIDEGRIDKNMQSEYNYAKGGYITEGDKQSDYANLTNEDAFKYVKKEIGTINGLPIKRYYEDFDRTADEEYVVELDDPKGDHTINIDFRFKRDENDFIIGIDSLKFYRTIYEPIEYKNIYYASAEYKTDYDFNRAFENLKENGEYIFNTIEDFEKFMRLIQLERILYENYPLPIKKKLVVTKDTSYYDLPNFKNIMKQIQKRFSKVWRSSIDEKFATRNDKYKMDYKPYILDTEKLEGAIISKIDYEDNMDYASIYLLYQEQREPKIYASSFVVNGSATYLANGQFYNLKIEIEDSSWFSKKKKKYQIKDYSDDQKELIAFLRNELKKTKKLK